MVNVSQNYHVPLLLFCMHFSLLDKQRYLSEFRVQTLRIQNYDLFHVLHYICSTTTRMEDRLPRQTLQTYAYREEEGARRNDAS